MSTNYNLFEEKGEPKRYRTEVLPLTSLTPLPLSQTSSLAMRFSHGPIYRSMVFRVRPCRDLRACMSPPHPVRHSLHSRGEPRPPGFNLHSLAKGPDTVHALAWLGQAHRRTANSKRLVYHSLPVATALTGYVIGSRKLSANGQFFIGAQTAVRV